MEWNEYEMSSLLPTGLLHRCKERSGEGAGREQWSFKFSSLWLNTNYKQKKWDGKKQGDTLN